MQKFRFYIGIAVVLSLMLCAVTAHAQQPTALGEGVCIEVLEWEEPIAPASLEEEIPTALGEGVSVEVVKWQPHEVSPAFAEETVTPTALGHGVTVQVLHRESTPAPAALPQTGAFRPAAALLALGAMLTGLGGWSLRKKAE